MTTILWFAGTAGAVAVVVVIALMALARRRQRHVLADVDIWTALDEELERARRYDHTVALIRLATIDVEGVDPARAADLPARLRASDRIAVSSHDAVVIAPETDPAGATRLAGRLHEHLGVPAGTTRIACFPRDALTRHALVQAIYRPHASRPVRRSRQVDTRRAV